MRRVAVLLGFVLFLLLPTSVSAAECQFVLGFATLRDLIGNEVVGECLENEHHNEIGDSVQQTTGGLLVWRKADNWTAFTDGYHSWVNGPNGLEQRLNVELLPWEAHNWIDTLPWVKDGISNTETRSVSALRILGVKYSRVFRALLETERDWLHTQGNPQHLPLEALLTVSAIDETAVMQLVQMPFLASYEVVDSVAIESLGRLSSQSLRQVVSHPSLGEFNTDEVAIRIVLLALRESDPEAAAKIEALSWVRDGIRSTPREDFRLGYIDPVKFERSVVQTLVRYSSRYRTFFQALVGKAWFQDGLHRREPEVIHDLEIIAQFGAPLGVQIIGMPFLDSVEEGDPTLLDQWIALLWDDPAGLYWILSHPRLAGGISHEQRATALILRLEREYPAAAAVMWAMPWIQDGVAESDFLPVFWLQQIGLEFQTRHSTPLHKNPGFRMGSTRMSRQLLVD